MHGGATRLLHVACSVLGLSPHARGSRRTVPSKETVFGSIPACTGEPCFLHGTGYANWVYPRMHGGAIAGAEFLTPYQGLSPPARGSHSEAPPNTD